MFREMRRKRQQLSDAACGDILRRAQTMVLALAGDDGYPYAVPLNFVYADGKIYFHCAKTGHKLDALRRCERLSLCVVDQDTVVPQKLTTCFRSVIAFGRACILQDSDEIHRAARLLGLKYNPDSDAVEREIAREWQGLCCVEITIDHMTGKQGLELMQTDGKQGEGER